MTGRRSCGHEPIEEPTLHCLRRPIITLVLALVVLACGSRTALDDALLGGEGGLAGQGSPDAGHDAKRDTVIDASFDIGRPLPPEVHPPGYVCYGDLTSIPGVQCTLSRSSH